jgi:hypothetical protein
VESNCTAGATCTAAAAVGAAGGGSILVKNKAIQELFDPTYGRMNATLGIEIPFTSALTQTTIPLGYVDPVTEEFQDGETQIWKITHNGVDSHPVHFHLLNVQVINRVGWDGTIKPPADNEYGWKETVRMNPLEDIVVAVRAKKPALPAGIGLPLSKRLRDPSQPAGVPMGFTQVDVVTGMPAVVTNQIDNFGWEYVWHCHILGHEENDFMRPVKFNANEAPAAAPTGLTLTASNNLTWTDAAVTEYKYQVYTLNNGTATLAETLPANSSASAAVASGQAGYAVVALGGNGDGVAVIDQHQAITAPTLPNAVISNGPRATFSWIDAAPNAAVFLPEYSLDGTTWVALTGTVNGTATTGFNVRTPNNGANALIPGNTYLFRVAAQTAPVVLNGQTLLPAITSAYTTPTSLIFAAPGAPVVQTPLAAAMNHPNGANTNTVALNFTAPTTGGAVTGGYRYQYVAVTTAQQALPANAVWLPANPGNATINGAGTTATITVPRGNNGSTRYWVRLMGNNQIGNGAASTPVLTPVTK